MVFAGVLAVVAVSCTKKGSSDDPAVVTSELWLKGRVINAVTNEAVPGASVVIEGQTALTTDATGCYTVNVLNLVPGSYRIKATASGFGYGSTEAQVSKNAVVANTIGLIPLSAPVTISPQGGTVSVPDPEAFKTGAATRLTIPPAAFSQAVSLSLTRFTGISVPGYAPAGFLNMGTFHIAPAGLAASVHLQAEIPLPFGNLDADNLALMKYDEVSDSWQFTGQSAIVNHTAGTATMEVTASGTYSLAVTGSYSETSGTAGAQTTIGVDPKQSSVMMAYQAKSSFPNGVPPAVSALYLTNLASQNSCLHGKKISFTDSTYTTVNYIGIKPDSVPAAKATAGGYYRWVPQVGRHGEEIPVITVIDGFTVNGIISKELHYGNGFWQFVHDQGGGGK